MIRLLAAPSHFSLSAGERSERTPNSAAPSDRCLFCVQHPQKPPSLDTLMPNKGVGYGVSSSQSGSL